MIHQDILVRSAWGRVPEKRTVHVRRGTVCLLAGGFRLSLREALRGDRYTLANAPSTRAARIAAAIMVAWVCQNDSRPVVIR